MNQPTQTQAFVDKLTALHAPEILAIEMLGSKEGEKDLSISDIDFLIICRKRKDIARVLQTARALEKEIFNIETTRTNEFVQQFFLASTSYNGVHIVALGRDEFDEKFRPVSRRLRSLTKLIGRNLFLFELQRNHTLLYGENVINTIHIEQPEFSEKLACYLFPSAMLIAALPSILFSKDAFRIWCFKIIKYHNTGLAAYSAITKSPYALDEEIITTANSFRYTPKAYPGSSAGLYFSVWGNIFRDAPLLFKRKHTQ